MAMRGALKAGALVALALIALDAKRAHGEPVVEGFTPSIGGPGTLVKIIGDGLDGLTGVRFGGRAAVDFYFVSPRHVKAWVPSDALSGPITVETTLGESTSERSFSVVGPPSFWPSLELAPPRPNPARVDVELAFATPAEARARFDVLDLAGRRVRSLVDGRVFAGVHPVRWDLRSDRGSRVGPGVYIVRLELDGVRLTRRLLVVP